MSSFITSSTPGTSGGGGGGAVASVNGHTGTVVLAASDVGADAAGAAALRPLGFGFDGGGSVLTPGSYCRKIVKTACTISSWDAQCSPSGNVVFWVKKATPVAGVITPYLTSICASAPPALTSIETVSSSTLTGWTLSLAAGDYVEVGITSVATATQASLQLNVS